MNREEFAVFVSAMRAYYGRENLLPNAQAMELWYKQLEDIPGKIAEAALNKWVAINKWSPSIAEIRQTATEIITGDMPDWGEAWEKVLKTVRAYGYNRQMEAMASLDDLTREAVRRVGWHDICMSENISIERASFRDCYNTLIQKKQKEAQLSPAIQNMIAEVQRNLKQIEVK